MKSNLCVIVQSILQNLELETSDKEIEKTIYLLVDTLYDAHILRRVAKRINKDIEYEDAAI